MADTLFPEAHALLAEKFDLRFRPDGESLDPLPLPAGMDDICAVFISLTTRFDRAAIDALPPSVKAICTYSVGTNHIDLPAAASRGVQVLCTPDVLSETCADTALLLMLGAGRRAVEGLRLLKSGHWQGWGPDQLLGKDLYGQRLGIFGLGRIGQAIARRARGFAMTVHYHNRHPLSPERADGARYHATLDGLLAQSDYFCVACPPSPQTRGIIDRRALSLLPAGAVVVNISRGDIINDDALIDALRSGRVAAAGLDVFAGEPQVNPAYQTLDNVFGLPHLGSATHATRLHMAAALRDGLSSLLAGKIPANIALPAQA
ncbi:2-hydroxyacid dehydrogenase [Martelella alba]|nr:D-glycerate dehydrogenase [Martelella alba]